MTRLNAMYDLAIGSMTAHQGAMSVAGRNISNASTPGYVRQEAILNTLGGIPGGIRFDGVRRVDDEILASRERTSDSTRAHAESLSRALSDLENGMTATGGDLVNAIAQLFGGIIDLTSAPQDLSLRSAVLGQASSVASNFRNAAATLSGAGSAADQQITSLVEEANRLARQIAASNKEARFADPANLDARDKAARQLAEMVGGQARVDADGMMRVTLSGGAVMVDGERTATLSAATGPNAPASLQLVDGNHRADVTDQVDGGKIGGLLSFRNGTLAEATEALDQLAFDFATQVNGVHRQHEGLDGVNGRDLFVMPGQTRGAAAAMAVDPTVAADPARLAAGTNAAGLHALAALADRPLAGGGTRSFTDQAIHTIGEIGAQAATAQATHEQELARSDALASMRDSLSGVSAEEELTKLAQLQRSHEASVRFVRAVDEMMSDLLDRV